MFFNSVNIALYLLIQKHLTFWCLLWYMNQKSEEKNQPSGIQKKKVEKKQKSDREIPKNLPKNIARDLGSRSIRVRLGYG